MAIRQRADGGRSAKKPVTTIQGPTAPAGISNKIMMGPNERPKAPAGISNQIMQNPYPNGFYTPQSASDPSAGNGGGGGGGSYGGGSYGGGGGGGIGVAPVVTPPSEEDYLAGDSGYTTQLSALQSALQRYIADSDFQRKNYETDYGKSLRDLGYDEGKKAWNWTDQLTASGRGYQNQLNDFGARGMLQSSGYADAFNELQRMLNQQYDSLSSAKTTYMTDLDNQIANYKGESTASQQAARAEALARRAAQYGV